MFQSNRSCKINLSTPCASLEDALWIKTAASAAAIQRQEPRSTRSPIVSVDPLYSPILVLNISFSDPSLCWSRRESSSQIAKCARHTEKFLLVLYLNYFMMQLFEWFSHRQQSRFSEFPGCSALLDRQFKDLSELTVHVPLKATAVNDG